MIQRIPPLSGTAFSIAKGKQLKVICPRGSQVSDMVCYNSHDLSENLSNGKTFDYEETLRLSTGNILYSNWSNPMFRIKEDSCGIHDFLLAPCCPKTMEHFYHITEDHPSCRENLFSNLRRFGIERYQIPTAFNIFMNVAINNDLTIKVRKPMARSGDYIILEALMDMVVGLTACSAADSNGNQYGPIDYCIF